MVRKHGNAWGLYTLTKTKLEGLVYQVKLSSGQEAGFSIPHLTSKISRGKQMEERPLSLPGLSADFNDYATLVAEVFGGRLVVCIDELDKIDNMDNLNSLLKGIKGIMGHEGSHFILTVSEDALARFSTRLRSQRDLIESSFEEIYFLSRVDLRLARGIINQLYHKEPAIVPGQRYTAYERNTMLVWIFGNGIPREIKRNLIVLNREGRSPCDAAAEDVWRTLMLNLLDNMHSWALLNADNEVDAYNFLRCLEKTRSRLPTHQYDFRTALAWFDDFISVCSAYYTLSYLRYRQLDLEEIELPVAADSKVSVFERGIFEVSLAAISLLTVCSNTTNEKIDELVTEIQKIFELVPYSPLFAAHRFCLFLKRQDASGTMC
jgi:hypothetical protein